MLDPPPIEYSTMTPAVQAIDPWDTMLKAEMDLQNALANSKALQEEKDLGKHQKRNVD